MYLRGSDVDVYVLVENDREKSFKTRMVDGRRFEFTYYPLKILRLLQEFVDLAKSRYKSFKYPADKIRWARLASAYEGH